MYSYAIKLLVDKPLEHSLLYIYMLKWNFVIIFYHRACIETSGHRPTHISDGGIVVLNVYKIRRC